MVKLIVQLPRGRTALVRVNPETGCFMTDHPGLYTTFFQAGVKDFHGHVRLPREGRAFVSALYDALFLRGYPVRWLEPGCAADLAKN
jgi:hypothetical protein